MKRFRILPLAALMVASVGAQAAGFSYDYVEASLGEYDSLDGFYVGGAMGLNEQIGLLGSVGMFDDGPFDVTVIRGGGLFHTNLQKDLDLFASLEIVYADFEVQVCGLGNCFGASDDDLGFGAAGGLRYAVQDNFQLEGKLTLTESDAFDSDLGISLNGRYYFNKQFSGALGIASDAEFDGVYLNARYDLK
ncbi:MAG: hypothetical protein ACLGHJ_10200 [Gammaproteobacteria bacterium]